MSITQYLDLAFATLADDRQRHGASLLEALDGMKEYAARKRGLPEEEPTPAGGNTYREPENNVVDMNNQSLAAFEAVMGGFNFG